MLISTEDIEQFREMGYFVTDVVFAPDELEMENREMMCGVAQVLEEAPETTAPEKSIFGGSR